MSEENDVLFERTALRASIDFDRTRLTQARLLRALKKSDLAALVGVSAAAIGQYESGVSLPRHPLKLELAKALRVHSDFFCYGRPKVALEEVKPFFRSLRASKVSERNRVVAVASLLWEALHVLETYVKLPEVNLPDCGALSPAEAAAVLRADWKIPDGPVKHLTRHAELNGIVLSVRPVAELETVDSFSMFIDERPIVIATPRRTNNVFRHRFSLAHELGHLVMHKNEEQLGVVHERQADQFAAAFLTPRAMVEPTLPKRVEMSAIVGLSHYWGVSSHSLVYRMRELGMCSEQSAQRAFIKLKQDARLSDDPLNQYPGETPSLLVKAFELATEEGLTMGLFSEKLGLMMSEVQDLLGLEDSRPVLRIIPGGRE